jgi:hypothetical protein
MFGELMRWNPAEELSNWHRDIDDLFGRFFQRPDAENSLNNWTPRVETYRKDSDYVIELIFRVLIRVTFILRPKEMSLTSPGNGKARKRDQNIGKLFTGSLADRFTAGRRSGQDFGALPTWSS